MNRWSLPGPASFLETLKVAVRDGMNVAIGAPIDLAGDITDAVDNCLQMEQWASVGPFEPGDKAPLEELSIELGLHAGDRPG